MYPFILLFLFFNISNQSLTRGIVDKIRLINFEDDLSDQDLSNDIVWSAFSQSLDHFNLVNKETFYQYYVTNDVHFNHKGLVFLYISGEGPLSEKWLLQGNMFELAKEYGALMVGLEHRFYGQSVPSGKLSTEMLQFLSAEQALEDLTNFKIHIDEKFLLKNPKYILFGGSYAGMLSSWARIKYPHLFYASVASSAPVNVNQDFSSFEAVVANSYSTESVGGSKECANKINNAFKMLKEDILSGEANKYYEKLEACEKPNSKNDWLTLLDHIRTIYDSSVQYNVKNKTMNIENVCSLTGDFINPIDGIIPVINAYLHVSKEKCLVSSYDRLLDIFKDEQYSNSDRAWFYQTCTEFGFYQTCDKDVGCLFADLDTLTFLTDICLVYNVNNHMQRGYVGHTQLKYGGPKPEGTRVVYINGVIDPWNPLGVYTEDKSREQKILITSDGSHCQEMKASRNDDSESLKNTRKELKILIDKWVNGL